MRKPGVRTKMHQIAMQHVQKENRQKPRVSAGFLAGAEGLVSAAASVGAGRSPQATSAPRHAPQAGPRAHLVAKSYRTLTKKSGTAKAIPDFLAGAEGLSLACRLGRFATERHWRSLAPRHAVLEWMWGGRSRQRGSGKVAQFSQPSHKRAVLVWCCELFLEKDCVSTTTSSFERKAPPPGGWPS